MIDEGQSGTRKKGPRSKGEGEGKRRLKRGRRETRRRPADNIGLCDLLFTLQGCSSSWTFVFSSPTAAMVLSRPHEGRRHVVLFDVVSDEVNA